MKNFSFFSRTSPKPSHQTSVEEQDLSPAELLEKRKSEFWGTALFLFIGSFDVLLLILAMVD